MKKRQDLPRSVNENESALMILMATRLLSHHEECSQGIAPTAAFLEPVMPMFWLTMARAAVALTTRADGSEHAYDAAGLARSWVHHALRYAEDAVTLYGAAQILRELAEIELSRMQEDEPEPATEDDRPGVLVEATDYLVIAARLSPARPDILLDLGATLALRADSEEGDAVSLLEQALLRGDQALGCFGEADRVIDGTEVSHPVYVRALSQAGLIRWMLAARMKDAGRKRDLLEEACRQVRQAAAAISQEPSVPMLLGEVLLELAWLPGSPADRRGLFEEARGLFAALAAADPKLGQASARQATAMVGLAALAGGGKELRRALDKAEELFARIARRTPGESEPHLDACRAWLRLAAEPSPEIAREGALRAVAAARQANAIEPGEGSYFLACGLSHLGEVPAAVEALRDALAREPELVTEALADPDLEAVWASSPGWRKELGARG